MKKKLLSILLTACMVLTLLPTVALAVGEGTGTPEAFTLNTSGVNNITNADQLAYVAQQVNSGAAGWASASYKLENDINLSCYTNWTPIGDNLPATLYTFQGTFDGGGYTISNLKISGGTGSYGLFGCIVSGTIRNIGLTGVDLTVTNTANALDQHIAGLITAAEYVKSVLPVPAPHGELVSRSGIVQAKLTAQVGDAQQRLNNISLRASHCLAAHAKVAAVKGTHGPQDVRQRHNGGFPATDCAVANQRCMARVRPPENVSLFF